MSHPFFNRNHAIQGFESLCTVFAMLALVFVCTDATMKGKIEEVAMGALTLAITCGVAAATIARHLQTGLLAFANGLFAGSSVLCVSWFFALIESPRESRNIIYVATYCCTTLVLFLLLRHARATRSNESL